VERCLACEAVVNSAKGIPGTLPVCALLCGQAEAPIQSADRAVVGLAKFPCSPRPRKRGSAPRVAAPPESWLLSLNPVQALRAQGGGFFNGGNGWGLSRMGGNGCGFR
jgi:hypothetical protein